MILVKVINDMVTYGLERFGLYYSRYRGYVVDNNDPNSQGRLKLQVPQIHGEHKSDYWAYPASTFAGPGYGIQLIPPINSLVWVSFEQGNTRRPLWHHGYYGTDEIEEELRDITKIWLKTIKGFLVEINDTDNTLRIIGQNEEQEEPLVLGDTLQEKFDEFLDIMINAQTIDLKPFAPSTIASLQILKTETSEFKSTNKSIGK